MSKGRWRETRRRGREEGSDSTECRAGSCQSGLLQQECSTGYRMEGGKRAGDVAGGKVMNVYSRGETEIAAESHSLYRLSYYCKSTKKISNYVTSRTKRRIC